MNTDDKVAFQSFKTLFHLIGFEMQKWCYNKLKMFSVQFTYFVDITKLKKWNKGNLKQTRVGYHDTQEYC